MTAGANAACFQGSDRLTPVRAALDLLREHVAPRAGTCEVALDRASGRVLAAPLVSPRDVPAFDNVAVDGWALAGADLAASGETRLALAIGRAAAGHPLAGALASGHAVRALTGAPMPEGADTVVMQEDVRVEGAELVLPPDVRPGANRRRRGEDVRAHATLFARGLRLEPRHLGVAAELGVGRLPVFERIKVALFSTGDELLEPGADYRSGHVFDANRAILKSLLGYLPVEVSDLGILADDAADGRRALTCAARDHHAIVLSGGASGGEEDHGTRTIRETGKLMFWRIAMKPGRPLAAGTIGDALVLGLPGNPVAASVCFLRFAKPALLRLAGAEWREPQAFPVNAGFSLERKAGRTEMLRARLERDARGRTVAQRIMREGSGILTSMTDADGLVEVPPDRTTISPGETVPFYGFPTLVF